MKKKGFLKGVLSFSSGVLFSRLTGLLRETILAMFFGATAYMDAFRVAYNIPNILRDLVAEGSLSAVVVPNLVKKEKKGEKEFFILLDKVISAILVYVTILVITLIFASPLLMKFIIPGFLSDPEKFNLTVNLTRIIFPFLLIVSLATVLTGVLNIYRHFFVSGFATVLFNTGIILSTIFLYPVLNSNGISPIYAPAIGVLVGGVLQIGLYIPFIVKHKYKYRFKNPYDKEINQMLKLMLPIIAGIAAARINVVVNTYIASFLAVGSISYLSYAFRLMTLPLGVLGVSISTVALPDMSREEDYKTFEKGMEMNFAFTIPAAFLLYVLAEPISGIIYQHGIFSYTDTLKTAAVLKIYAFGIPFLSIVKLISSLFYSRNQTKIPALITMFSVVVNVGVALIFLKALAYRSLALSLVVSAFFNASVLWIMAYKRFNLSFGKYLLKSVLLWVAKSFIIIIPVIMINRFIYGNTITIYLLQLVSSMISVSIWFLFVFIRRKYGRNI